MRLIFVLAFLIIYGSLYPFHFNFDSVNDELFRKLFNFNFFQQGYADIVSNIILFIPLGFIAVKSLSHKSLRLTHWLVISCGIFSFAFAIQIVQLWTPDRVPSGGDAIWNLVGGFLGGLLCQLHFSKESQKWLSLPPVNQVYLYLGVLLVLINWTPFVPSLDFGTVINNLKTLVFQRQISIYWVCEKALLWLICFYFLKKSGVLRLTFLDCLAIIAITLCDKVLIADSPLTIDHIVGAMLGYILWLSCQKLITDKLIAFLLILLVVSLALYPFELNSETQDFRWLPFSGALGGNILVNILAMVKKCVLYACVVWALYIVTRRLFLSSIVVSVIIFACEYAQIYLIQSVPEITDGLLVLMAGYALSKSLKRHVKNEMLSRIPDVPTQKMHTTNIPQTERYFFNATPALDGLRAVAALSVFMVHYYQEVELNLSFGAIDIGLWMFNGNTGVALFFILSGFLLSIPFWLSKVNNQPFPNIKYYFIRRAARILPAYYTCLVGVLILQLLMGSVLNFNSIISHLFFLHNHKDYQVLDLNPPFWSLAVEVQFYLFLPLFFLVVRRLKYNVSLLLFSAAVFVSYLTYLALMKVLIAADAWPIHFPLIWPFGVSLESADGGALRYATLAHLPHFLLGVATAALFIVKGQWFSQKWQLSEGLFWGACVGIFAILATSLDNIFEVEFGRYNFPYVPILLAVMVFTAPLGKVSKYLLQRPVVLWIGKLSYGIYLYHYLVLNGVKRVFGYISFAVNDNMLLFALVSFCLTLAIAYLSYRLIERPILYMVKAKQGVFLSKSSPPQISSSCEKDSSTRTLSATVSLKKVSFSVFLFSVTALVFFLLQMDYEGKEKSRLYPWDTNEVNMIFDHHTHTHFSDGSLEVDDLVSLAKDNGCDAIAITEHTSNKKSLTKRQLDEIKLARIFNPDILVVSGAELNPPSYKGREHVNALFSLQSEEDVFRTLAETIRSPKNKKLTDQQLFSTLASFNAKDLNILAIYNHPSRKDESKIENKKDYLKWSQGLDLFIGFSGAPGHQKSRDFGSYRKRIKTIDRWDPVVAEVGGAWDQLLEDGHDVWGAIASSDYHNSQMDYAPCEFSRIHVKAPEKSYTGLFRALKSGTFWASHGRFLSELDLALEISEQNLRVSPGEAASTKENSLALVDIKVKRAPEFFDFPLSLELITNCVIGQPESLEKIELAAFHNQATALIPINTTGKDGESCYLRSRVSITSSEGEIFKAYTNHIRLWVN